MDTRRLAISSLLCADGPTSSPVAGPSHSPHPRPDHVESDTYSQYNRSEQQEPFHASSSYGQSLPSEDQDVVPLTLEPVRHTTPPPHSDSILPSLHVHPRRAHKEIIFDDEPSVSNISNSVTTSHFEVADYHHTRRQSSHFSDSALSHPSHPPVDPYQYQSQPYSSLDCTHSLARPSSSRSGYSGSPPSPYTLPPQFSLSPNTHSHSPSRSPLLTYSSQYHTPSESPTVTSHRTSASPVHHYHSRQAQPSHTSGQARSPYTLSPVQSFSNHRSATRSYNLNPRPSDPQQASPRTRPSLPSLLTQSPPVSRASAASLPNILNGMSPTIPRTPASDFGPLEALVQAATEERRRISGEMSSGAESRGSRSSESDNVSGSRNSRTSPVVERRGGSAEPQYPSYSDSPSYQGHTVPVSTSPIVSSSRLLQEDYPSGGHRIVHDGEPPTKRRRRSNEALSPSGHLFDAPHPLDAASTVQQTSWNLQTTPIVPLPASIREPEQIRHYDIAEVKTEAAKATLASPTASDQCGDAGDGDKASETRKEPTEVTERSMLVTPEVNTQEARPKKSKKGEKAGTRETAKGKERGRSSAVAGMEMKPKQPVESVGQEAANKNNDAHDWLLEQYSSPRRSNATLPDEVLKKQHSPSPPPRIPTPPRLPSPPLPSVARHPSSRRLSASRSPVRPTASPTTMSHPSSSHAHKHVVEKLVPSKQLVPSAPPNLTQKKPAKKTPNATRTPTPVSLLEQELDRKTSDDLKVTDADIDMELDLVAGTSSSSLQGHNAKQEDAMDMDVDDELLSLIDDKPRTSQHSHVSRSAPSHPSVVPVVHPKTKSKPAHAHKPAASSHLEAAPTQSVPAPVASSERGSMPPPASTSNAAPREDLKASASAKKADRAESVEAPATKKKETTQKPPAKIKQAPKAKPKTTTKAKPKAPKDSHIATTSNSLSPAVVSSVIGKGKKTSPMPGSLSTAHKRAVSATTGGASRSRSTSVMPPPSETDKKTNGEEGEVADDRENADDKLYCICKTSYDEDRVMIACDRCDEWYHTQCVNMPDLEVDLVDQFICPVCVQDNPSLSLKTTYKRRCLCGLKHPKPSSPDACHKPARGAFSKYCSDECGIRYMQSRINAWGGDKGRLWDGVKDAEKREAVVVRCVATAGDTDDAVKIEGQEPAVPPPSEIVQEVVKPTKSKMQRELDILHAQLDKIAKRREEIKKDVDVMLWREKLTDLATARAETVDECGWDQRLCFGDEEYAEFGPGVLESYDEDRTTEDGGSAMQVDGVVNEEGEWWCRGKKKCDRHAGWQKLRQAEVAFEKETMENSLSKLTTQERELRKRIEDVMDHKSTSGTGQPAPTASPLQPLNGKLVMNGTSNPKTNGELLKKGKKHKHEAT